MSNLKKIIPISIIALFCTYQVQAQGAPKKNKSPKAKTTQVKKKPIKVVHDKVAYKKSKGKVVTVRTLPKKNIIKHKGVNYYYANKRYYTYTGGRYIPIIPKAGFRIKTLPVGYIVINRPSRTYFWFNGIFYTKSNNEYEVIEPEIGTVIYELAPDAEKVTVNGNTYYEYSNVLYEKVQINGSRAYEVVGYIEG
ncbi:hypothetical protein DNU06_01805 [Putridiphycobacter roseus]|uniref:Orphan protein n=1 Tax=Putridiphycobacter roseus TaxID=2219161 RepID=A0A2W1N4U2_9FLAO|nr:DUF6515 family protein [Putridiphycobacter roseus]PZE18590.1 hypothetical protein DNU06_01805 [Putridiphycobacter roseus]